jgi:predicted MFS family arabinose efflux permease
MALSHDDFRFVYWMAVLPAAVSVALVAALVRDPDASPVTGERRFPIRRDEMARLRMGYWLVVAFGAVLTLARFSEAFLLLRAESVGLPRTYVPLVLIVMNAFYAGSAYPLGRLADGLRPRVLGAGIGLLIAADLVLAGADTVAWVLAGAALWGLHLGATQGLLMAIVADVAPPDLRGTAFGLFHLVTGAALLAASVLAGWLWSTLGPPATFLAGAALSGVAGMGLVGWAGTRSSRPT